MAGNDTHAELLPLAQLDELHARKFTLSHCRIEYERSYPFS